MNVTRQFLLDFYSEELWPAINEYGIHPLESDIPWLVGSERLFFCAGTVGIIASKPTSGAVLASTCIDHAEADTKQLSAAVVADLVHAAIVSQALSLPLLSFIGVGEEIRLVPSGSEYAAHWAEVANVVTEIFQEMRLPPGSQIFNTHDERTWEILSSCVENDRKHLCERELNGLYHITDGSYFPLGTPFQYYYEYYRYNIAHYRQPVLEQLLGHPPGSVLIVENTQQIKAIAAARRLNGAWPSEHLVTLSAPGRSGHERNTRAAAKDRLLLDELRPFRQTPGRVAEMGLTGGHLHFWVEVCQHWKNLFA